MKLSNVSILILFLFSCNNPQSTNNVLLNIDRGILGKWKLLNTGVHYTFNPDGNYTCLDTSREAGTDTGYTEQYRTYYDRYLNITGEIGRLCLFGCPGTDTIFLVDAYEKYTITGDTLIFKRSYIGFTSSSSTLIGYWRQIPPKLYRVNNRYIYDTSKTTYLNFSDNNFLNTNAQWFGASFPPPYLYIDHSTYFELQSTNVDLSYPRIDYDIVDTTLFLLWPPYAKNAMPDLQPETLIRTQ
jgi:hypothetical protein